MRQKHQKVLSSTTIESDPLLPATDRTQEPQDSLPTSTNASSTGMDSLSRRTQWLVLAVASGACAAINGVFAKLTTTELTTSWAEKIASGLGLSPSNKVVEFGVRGNFFVLNLIFNGIMWALFTAALAKGTSTTQVSIVNTSANFMITAMMGFLIFSEALPPSWWAGAGLLAVGNVVIGRKEEHDSSTVGQGSIALGDDEPQADQPRTRRGSDLEGIGAENEELLDVRSSVDELKLGEDIDDPLK